MGTFTTRPPQRDDAAAIADLRNAVHLGEIGSPYTDVDEVLEELTSPHRDPAEDGLLVFAPSGELVGSMTIWAEPPHTRIDLDNYVHPAWRGQGIGTLLMDRCHARAAELAERAPRGSEVQLRTGAWRQAEETQRFLIANSFRPVRVFSTMEIEMVAPPPVPQWPPGITVRTMDPVADVRAVYEAETEAFRDHWGDVTHTFETWKHETIDGAHFEPSLVFLAMDGEEIAGSAFCVTGLADNLDGGYISSLSVRGPWRRRGIALALLLQTFGAVHRRGYHRVTLDVDSENVTGAKHLYERAGMRVFREHVVFAKVLVEGAAGP